MPAPRWRLWRLPDGRLQPQLLDRAGKVMLVVPAERAYSEPPSAEAAVYRMSEDAYQAAMHWHGLTDWRRRGRA